MTNEGELKLQRMVAEIQQKRIDLAGRDNYAEGYWHGIAVGMLAVIRLQEEYGRTRKCITKKH